jgi:hypothetical protein
MRGTKEYLKSTKLYGLLLEKRRARIYRQWSADGCALPAPPQVKQTIVASYQEQFDLRVLVETGTFMGDMIMAQRYRFDRIYSIELSRALYEQASFRFRRFPHITIVHGDSGSVLPSMTSTLPAGTLFWLDGHWSGGDTSRGEKLTPILKELEAILRRPAGSDVILIDDARCFDGADDYPAISTIQDKILSCWPGTRFTVEHDVMRAIPAEFKSS